MPGNSVFQLSDSWGAELSVFVFFSKPLRKRVEDSERLEIEFQDPKLGERFFKAFIWCSPSIYPGIACLTIKKIYKNKKDWSGMLESLSGLMVKSPGYRRSWIYKLEEI